jgi:hypothetical protein
VEADEEIPADEQIDLGRAETLGLRIVDRVHHEVEVVLVLLELGKRGVGDAVLDGQRVEAEGGFEHQLDLFLGRTAEIDPQHDPGLVAQRRQRIGRRIVCGETRVAVDERGDHG